MPKVESMSAHKSKSKLQNTANFVMVDIQIGINFLYEHEEKKILSNLVSMFGH